MAALFNYNNPNLLQQQQNKIKKSPLIPTKTTQFTCFELFCIHSKCPVRISQNTFFLFPYKTWVLTDCCPGEKSQSTPLNLSPPPLHVMNICQPHLYRASAPLNITVREVLCCAEGSGIGCC